MSNAPIQPIGLFDSGFGGLTVLKQVRQLLPYENTVYLGDTARLPYGSKSPQTIIRFAEENAHFLLEKKIKILIVACHTACSHSFEILKNKLPIPVIGVIEPGAKLLAEATKTKRVAVLGTASTIGSGIYQNLFHARYPQIQIYPVSCPLFVPLIEEGFCAHPAAESIAKDYLSRLGSNDIDAALLACTHYPLMRAIIQKTLGAHVELIEPAQAAAEEAASVLRQINLLNESREAPTIEFYATDDPEKFQRLGKAFLGREIERVTLKKNYESAIEKK